MAQTSWGNKPWESMTNDFKYIITEAIFAKFAHLGSFIISGDYFISQYGTLFYNNNGTIETTVINASNVSKLFGGSVAYAWFADSDPMVDTMPTTGNYKFRPTKCIDALSGEEWMAGGNMHVSQRGDLTVKGATMFSRLHQDYFDLVNTDTGTTPYTRNYLLHNGLYEWNNPDVGSIRMRANYAVLVGGVDYNPNEYNYNFTVNLPPARFLDGMEVTIIINTRSYSGDNWLVPITLRVPSEFDGVDPVLDDTSITSKTWNRFATLFNDSKVIEGSVLGVSGTHLITNGASLIKLIAVKHPYIEFYHPSGESQSQAEYNKKCIAWCVVDVK